MIPRISVFDFDDDAPSNNWSKWGMGLAIPLVIAVMGVSKTISQHASLLGFRRQRMPLTGWDAVAFGIVLLAVAFFMHSHYFWSNTRRMIEYVDLGRAIALLAGIASLGFIVVRNFSLV